MGYNRSKEKTERLVAEGGMSAYSLEELVDRLEAPRVVWLMLPAGAATIQAAHRLEGLLDPGDILVDGSNSFYKDAIRRAWDYSKKGLNSLDVGVSGGIWGLENGYCLMAGGSRSVYNSLIPVFDTLSHPDGHIYCGGPGAGHFVKMVHNGIEYGMMQAYAEGFAMLQDSRFADELNFSTLAGVWNRGSVIQSWLLEMAQAAFAKSGRLDEVDSWVEDSGEGRWTVQQAVETETPIPVLALSLMERFSSRRPDDFRNKVLAALRREFGGHAVRSGGKKDA
ncbi:phosphogluconate dehydrogenase (NAD(+)-dependent, decarboxylating) [Salidesulfovibrio brasiliensis]|uniref:phosphogluconate dehydrogenase (NAD(+)-dependent, decarboxylating) n=1 Tax=Salidesulfovibrio brasiliensis TaxID=221711 RepID=UPI000ACAA558